MRIDQSHALLEEIFLSPSAVILTERFLNQDQADCVPGQCTPGVCHAG
jgi:hypothetical protein